MDCEYCGDVIGDRATRYEQVTPLEGGGQTTDGYCSVQCLNAGVEFTEDEIVALMRQESYVIPENYDSPWEITISSNVGSLIHNNTGDEGEYNIYIESRKEKYDIEIYHEPDEQIYHITLYEYDLLEGQKVGLDPVEQRYTSIVQRALAHAEDLMEMVEEGEIES